MSPPLSLKIPGRERADVFRVTTLAGWKRTRCITTVKMNFWERGTPLARDPSTRGREPVSTHSCWWQWGLQCCVATALSLRMFHRHCPRIPISWLQESWWGEMMEQLEKHPWNGCSGGVLGSREEKGPWREAVTGVPPRLRGALPSPGPTTHQAPLSPAPETSHVQCMGRSSS